MGDPGGALVGLPPPLQGEKGSPSFSLRGFKKYSKQEFSRAQKSKFFFFDSARRRLSPGLYKSALWEWNDSESSEGPLKIQYYLWWIENRANPFTRKSDYEDGDMNASFMTVISKFREAE
jgi:hypothetical protein